MLRMVKIKDCSVNDCAYNKNQQCHTMAITVGSACPSCDAYMSDPMKGGIDATGGVGSCHMKSCRHNSSLECAAPGIEVGRHEDHAECVTYEPR